MQLGQPKIMEGGMKETGRTMAKLVLLKSVLSLANREVINPHPLFPALGELRDDPRMMPKCVLTYDPSGASLLRFKVVQKFIPSAATDSKCLLKVEYFIRFTLHQGPRNDDIYDIPQPKDKSEIEIGEVRCLWDQVL